MKSEILFLARGFVQIANDPRRREKIVLQSLTKRMTFAQLCQKVNRELNRQVNAGNSSAKVVYAAANIRYTLSELRKAGMVKRHGMTYSING